jgi:Fe-S-cluster containining protein
MTELFMTLNDGASQAIKPVEIVNGKLNFVCLAESCPEPCCGPFAGVQNGIAAVDGRPFHEIVLTEKDSRRLIAAGQSHMIDMRQGQNDCMRLLEDGTCTAFKNGRCSIHACKPTVCVAFPFYVDMFVGLCCVTACPGFSAGWTPLAQLVSEIEAARNMYRFWLETIERQGVPLT